MTIKEKAEKLLCETGLLSELQTYGEPHPIGSYRMDMMVYNDLDIDIRNDSMTLEKLHDLTYYILKNFSPTWYEAREEVNDEGKTVWFHGFHAIFMDELWNFDLWFFDQETITKAEAYCDAITGSVKKFVSLVKDGSFLVRMKDMTILIEKEYFYASNKGTNSTDYLRKQHQ